ncbi:claspin isoform X2 [Ceratitis capitata]|uniref:(Mediterranean fruit fly) hypothetical protein n=1 Tax=Ceratitis capitata TaxID=7213 RepID=W8C8G8_CERCA|nr:claspin isoform X2 [Ceratitis capitata]CAD7004482.1 unnamed protein product [Ceratitis capitata]
MGESVVDISVSNGVQNSVSFKSLIDDESDNESEMNENSLSDANKYVSREDTNELTNVEDETHLDDGSEDEHGNHSEQPDMQALQSRQQRLQREAQFSVPYHKPKRYTLQEFLSRRTIIKPSETVKRNTLSESLGKSRSLKMSKEELEIYSKLMEERAKEASEFFQGENADKINERTTEDNENGDTIKNTSDKRKIGGSTPTQIQVQNLSKDCGDKPSSNVVITEIVELPKLDIKDLAKDFNLSEIVKQTALPKQHTFSLSHNPGVSNILNCGPTLKDNINITFDFITRENDAPRTISRANSLLERLMKTNPCHKSKKTIDPKCISKTLIDDAEPSLNKKPGQSFLKLKDSLKSIILDKRREEIKKKQLEENKMKNLDDEIDLDEPKNIDDSLEQEDELSHNSSDNFDCEPDCESINGEESEGDIHLDKDLFQKPLVDYEDDQATEEKMRLELHSDDSNNDTHLLSPAAISQVPATQICNAEEEADQLMTLCSGTFETQHTIVPNIEPNPNKIISSDDESSSLSSNEIKRSKKFTKKIKKSKMKLGFSDDEEDEDDKSEGSVDAVNEHISHNDLPATYIDYDSEENEITVELTKEDCLKQAENFFEKEAELSDSEWGSADEDEKNLDQYDIELGDEDEFDKEEVRAQLEKIHARKMLDEDIRQVNKLQEILFEDEEEAAQRQRKFRWKNFDTSFNIESCQNNLTETKPEEGSDDENEHLWRKIRFEREQAIKNQSLNDSSLEAGTSINTSKSSEIKNVTVVSVSKTMLGGSEVKEKSPFLISKECIKSESAKARSSFLLRNKKVLTKTICSVKTGGIDGNTSPDKVGVKSTNSNKFVFTTLTFEEHEILKRKADDSNAIDMKVIKKPRTEEKKGEYLIDKLL